ncbi:MAG TPA: STAS domain-containing protein [Acidobacteriaceae bacterium]|jgi:anti-sigma B factor antagonist|nr:STAS domain-containing protein [Acidobacteriaceae bacterium]
MPLDARTEILPDRTAVVTITGSMTAGTSLKLAEAQLQQAVAQEVQHLVLDLSGVDYADSAGLGLLVHTYGLMNRKGGILRLCGVQPRILSLLQMTKTDLILPADSNREASLAILKS